MRNIGIVFKNTWKSNKIMLLGSIVIAMAIIGMFILTGNTPTMDPQLKPKVMGIIDEDNTFISKEIEIHFQEVLGVEVVKDSYHNLNKELINYNISVIMTIPKGFYDSLFTEEPLLIKMETLNDFENVIFFENDVNNYLSMVQSLISLNDDKDLLEEILTADTEKISFESKILDNHQDYETGILLMKGILIVFLAFLVTFIPMEIHRDKTTKIYQRIKITKITPTNYVMGLALYGYLLIMIVIVIVSTYLYISEIPIDMPIWIFATLLLLYGSFAIGFGILLGMICNSKNTIGFIISSFYTITSMVGGAWFPINENAGWLFKLAKFSPAYWAINVSGEEYAYLTNILILVLVNLFVFLAAITIFKGKEE